MKLRRKMIGILLCMMLLLEGNGWNFIEIRAASDSIGNQDFVKYLIYGYDVIETPNASAEEIKNVPILDKSKLAALKGNDWYDNKPGNRKFKYQVFVKENQYELEKTIAASFGVKVGAACWALKTQADINYTERNFQNDYYGKVVSSYTLDQFSSTLDTAELRECVSDRLVNAVKAGEYERVFKEYGTHLIRQVLVGGRLQVDFHTLKSSHKTQQEIKALAEGSYKILSGSASYSSSTTVQEFSNACDYRFSGIGGNMDTLPGSFNQNNNYINWCSSVKNEPALYQVAATIPVWEILPDATLRKNLEKAYYKYYNEHLTSLRNRIPFITDMRVTARGNDKVDSEILSGEIVTKTDAEYDYKNSDLNAATGGKYLYLIYKTGTDQKKKVTDIIVNHYKDSTTSPAKAGYTHINVDLNKGASGGYIYVDYKRENNIKATGYQALCSRSSAETLSDEWVPIKNASGQVISTNEGTKKRDIYLYGYVDPLFRQIDNQIAENNVQISRLS